MRSYVPGMMLSALLCVVWARVPALNNLRGAGLSLAITAVILWLVGAISDRVELRRRPASPFPNVPCVCGCPGPAHKAIWADNVFKGTVCPMAAHGGHKYAMDLVAGRGPDAL